MLGLLYAAKGERGRASRHLKQFIKRNAEDPMRSITLAAGPPPRPEDAPHARDGEASGASVAVVEPSRMI